MSKEKFSGKATKSMDLKDSGLEFNELEKKIVEAARMVKEGKARIKIEKDGKGNPQSCTVFEYHGTQKETPIFLYSDPKDIQIVLEFFR